MNVIQHMEALAARAEDTLVSVQLQRDKYLELHREEAARAVKLMEELSHLQAVIVLAKQGKFTNPPGPLKEIDLEEAEKAAQAGADLSVQRVRQGSPASDQFGDLVQQ